MRGLGRAGQILKWAGLVVSLLIVVAWAVSVWWFLAVWGPIGDGFAFVACFSGKLVTIVETRSIPRGWEFRPNVDKLELEWMPSYVRDGGQRICLPLWMPFLFVVMLTAYLFWRDHRLIPPGHCQKCGYSLTGNLSGVCPECGVEIDRTHLD